MNPLTRSPGLAGSAVKSAQTRFNNDRQAAKQATLTGTSTTGAKQVFKRTTQALRKPAQEQVQEPQQPVQQFRNPQGVPPVQMQTQFFSQNPVTTQPPGPEFDPDSFVKNELDKIVANRRLERVMSSPEVHASVTRTKLQDYFKRNDPMAIPDTSTTSQKVLGNLRPYADGR